MWRLFHVGAGTENVPARKAVFEWITRHYQNHIVLPSFPTLVVAAHGRAVGVGSVRDGIHVGARGIDGRWRSARALYTAWPWPVGPAARGSGWAPW